jgi:O-acetyl-ADP-ribose deacetylase (regulator of RNase III)
MIHKVKGDILKADVEALVNTVNTVGVMGRGIALQFKRAFPENYKAYSKACEQGDVETGKVFTFDSGSMFKPRYVINFPTKKHWRNKSKIEYIEQGLESLIEEIKRLSITSIAVPPLGCGLGGLNWPRVFKLISAALSNIEGLNVLVYEPAGAPKAKMMENKTKKPKMTFGRAVLLRLMKDYLDSRLDFSITLLEIQKLLYFFQETGVSLRLKYVQGSYGPYAENLRHVLSHIEGHFVVGFGDGSETPGKEIEYIPEALDEAIKVINDKPEILENFKKIGRLIEGFETPYGLELLASIHWVATQKDAKAKEDVETAVKDVHSWSDRKRKLFKEAHIRAAWSRLKDKGWI